jgi:hypothetical protein
MWPWNLMANPGAEAQAASAESDAKSSTRSTRRKPAADK